MLEELFHSIVSLFIFYFFAGLAVAFMALCGLILEGMAQFMCPLAGGGFSFGLINARRKKRAVVLIIALWLLDMIFLAILVMNYL